MHLDNLQKAVELQAQLKLWQEALSRAGHGVFKAAQVRVVGSGHGHQGQSAETIIELRAEHVRPFAELHIARVVAELRELGVEI